MRIAVVGAGIAGLACAAGLKENGHAVALFDKGRQPGGRMSTRRAEAGGRTLRFDHGAQYFTARDDAFRAQVLAWERAGVAARWPAAGDDAWVGAPGMSAPAAAMAEGLDVATERRVEAIAESDGGWRLLGGGCGDAAYDAVVIAVPAEQAAPLLAPHAPDFAARAAATRSEPCWTAMAAFDAPIGGAPDILRGAGAIGWAARDGAKPGRGGGETWVVQASPGWSAAHLEEDREPVAEALLEALAAALGHALPRPIHAAAHRWRYAKSGAASGRGAHDGALWAPADRIGACGDWLIAPRVESAWLSGRRLAALVG